MKIPEIKIVLRPKSKKAKSLIGFKWAGKEIGKRSKIGGEPTWIQRDETPSCDNCHKPMAFYSQLDSVGDKLCLADCGMIYVFICFDCYETKSIFQSY